MKTSIFDDEEYFNYLRNRPSIAVPTVILLFVCLGAILSSWMLVINKAIPLWLGCICNCLAYYYLFAPIHDGLHRSISTNDKVNDVLTKLAFIATTFNTKLMEYSRLYHMQHHIKCGDHEMDPDLELSSNPKNAYSLWFIWGSQYFGYHRKYKDTLPSIKGDNLMLHSVIMVICILVLAINFPMELLFLWLVPLAFMAWMIAFVFSYLPHHIHQQVPGEDPMNKYQTTCNRLGWEWLLIPVLQYQNYHLSHHIYPTVPFYRYEKIWKARLSKHREQKGVDVFAFSGKLITK